MAMIRRFKRSCAAALFSLLTFVSACHYHLDRRPHPQFASAQPLAEEAVSVVGFEQTRDSIQVSVEPPATNFSYVKLAVVPPLLDVRSLGRRAKDLPSEIGSVIIPLEDDGRAGEHSIIIFIGKKNYIELVRQPENWLRSKFSYERPGGYTILGRRSVRVGARESISTAATLYLPNTEAPNAPSLEVSEYPEINRAAGLLAEMWRSPIHSGPTSKSYDDFARGSFREKMERVRNGEFSVMCQGFRDLFVHGAASSPGLKVRLVDAENYSPGFPDLVSYSHAAVEVWVSKIGKWVLLDPWYGFMIAIDGVPLSAEELQNLDPGDGAEVERLVENTAVYFNDRLAGSKLHLRPHDAVRLDHFSCGDLGCSPPYIEYYRAITIRPIGHAD